MSGSQRRCRPFNRGGVGTLHSPWQSQPQDTGGSLEDSPGSCLDYVTVPTTAVHAWFQVHCCHTSTISHLWNNFLLCCCFLLEWSTLVGYWCFSSIFVFLSVSCMFSKIKYLVRVRWKRKLHRRANYCCYKKNRYSYTVYNLLILYYI